MPDHPGRTGGGARHRAPQVGEGAARPAGRDRRGRVDAEVGQRALRRDALEAAEHVVGERDRVDAEVEQRPAGQLGLGQPGRAARPEQLAVVGVDDHDLAQGAGVDGAPDDVVVRQVAAPHRLGGQQPRRLRGGQHLVGLAQAAGERLLHEHRLAGAQREEGVLVVLAVRAGDVHGIHVGVGHQVGVRAVGSLHAVPGGDTPAPARPTANPPRRPASGCPRARHPRRRWRCRRERARPSGSVVPPSGRERWGRRARGVRAAYVAA